MPTDELSLNARWSLAHFDEGRGEAEGAHLPDYDDSGWMDAVVPGDVHLDLMRVGTIPDPFVGLNHLECRWIEDKEWWYRREFFAPEKLSGRRLELRFGGLDTFATVWINGKLAGKHRNMFIPSTMDVTDLISCGHRNSVAVCLSSPIKAVEGKPTDGMIAAFETRERLYARKAQMSYGWDIAPRIVTTGIWRPVYLVARGDVCIGDVAVRTDSVDSTGATIGLEVPLSRNSPRADSAELRIEIRSGRSADPVLKKSESVSLRGDGCVVRTNVHIPNPRLWWPWNVGRPELYRLSVKALVRGKVAEEYVTRFGIRTVELLQEPQNDGGLSFIFKINGERVYAKGTNWIPGDAIFARMDHHKYREMIDLAQAQNVNMLRIWGGGIYEDPYFYRLCDERGIMVWQDFMFTCAEYPRDREFLAQVRHEAEQVVSDLRNHPSVVLWCGDNEVDATSRWSGKDFGANKINREVLPEVCARFDPTRPYIPSSPFSPSDSSDPLRQDEGDNHIWHHGTSYKDEVYAKDTSRFVSEIGHLSTPWPESIRRFIPEADLWPPGNRVWDTHFGTVERCDPRRREKLDQAIAAFGMQRPDNLDDYAYVSQLIQALAYKEWMERYRRRKFLCGGSLYWNLYDNWPQLSDAVVDYYGNPKMGYYFVARAFANLLVSLQDLESGTVGVWLVNDELRDRAGKLLLRCQRLDGGTSWTRVLRVKMPANSSRMVWDMRLPSPLMEDPCACFAQVQLQMNGRIMSEAFYFPVECAEMKWPETRLSASVTGLRRSRGRITADVAIASNLYGRLIRIETPARRSVFSDNFLDIPPGEERSVRMTSAGDEPLVLRISAANAPRPVEAPVP